MGLVELVERLPQGIDTVVHERGQSLSSGERQLIALARAFLAHPRVLVLDEATSNLDLQSETKIEGALDALLEDRTAVLIAHRLSTAMRADRIVVIDAGRVAEVGTHRDLVEQGGRYAEMFATWERQADHDHTGPAASGPNRARRPPGDARRRGTGRRGGRPDDASGGARLLPASDGPVVPDRRLHRHRHPRVLTGTVARRSAAPPGGAGRWRTASRATGPCGTSTGRGSGPPSWPSTAVPRRPRRRGGRRRAPARKRRSGAVYEVTFGSGPDGPPLAEATVTLALLSRQGNARSPATAAAPGGRRRSRFSPSATCSSSRRPGRATAGRNSASPTASATRGEWWPAGS